MINVMFALLAKRAFSNVLEGMGLENIFPRSARISRTSLLQREFYP